MNDLYTFIAGAVSGFLSAMGFGGGGVLVLYLTLVLGVSQTVAQGINLMFFIPTALIATVIYALRRQINFKKLLRLVLMGLPGCALGWWLSGVIETTLLSKAFGAALVALGFFELLRPRKNDAE